MKNNKAEDSQKTGAAKSENKSKAKVASIFDEINKTKQTIDALNKAYEETSAELDILLNVPNI